MTDITPKSAWIPISTDWGAFVAGVSAQTRVSLDDGTVSERFQGTFLGASIRVTVTPAKHDVSIDVGAGFVAGAQEGVNGFIGPGLR